MRKRIALFLGTAVVIFSLINVYVGLRGWQWIRAAVPQVPLSGWEYWLSFLLVSLAFPLSRFAKRLLPGRVSEVLTIVGAYWLPIWLQLLPLLLVIDIARWLNRWLGWIPPTVTGDIRLVRLTGGAILVWLVAVLLYGVWRARTPVVVRYEMEVPKNGRKHQELELVLVSDTHFGVLVNCGRVRRMVNMVNRLNPDLILLAGDLVDDHLTLRGWRAMAAELKKLKAKLGTYSVRGNHDDPAGDLAGFRRQMKRAGIQLLVDESINIDDSFVLVGRNDLSARAYTGRARPPLSELLSHVDPSQPLILMDHQPFHLDEAQQAGVDLQVSGHTHRGQLFPFHYITQRLFELDWGYLHKAGTHVVVSLGFGTWGPPVRIGNRPEVVSIGVRFTRTRG